uniref:Variant surface glycoprotein 1125.2839 n=1 Tax=Trypanosoma brucei TaxID=5691 RepID=A0A1J0R8W9_9TRYP|nr:variant surface glycoprotein 1125.2839 [Trypanosoma brucei]
MAINKIKEAAFGVSTATPASVTQDKAFGCAINRDTRENVCVGEAASKKVKSAVTALVCLCMKSTKVNYTAQTGFCTDKADGTTGWDSATSSPNTGDTTKIAKSCHSKKGQEITPRNLIAATEKLKSLIHTDGTHGYLGAYKTSGCNGSSGHGVCVKFTGYLADHDTTIKKLTWLSSIRDLETQLNERKEEKAVADRINDKPKQLSNAAAAAVEEAETTASEESSTAIINGKTKSNVKTAQCSAKTNTTCTRAGCKWEGTCKPKDKKEKRNATGTEAETGCAKHKPIKPLVKTKKQATSKIVHLERGKIMSLI